MESLLRWGIANSADTPVGNAPPAAPRQDLDPAIIDHILGKSDAQLMKEALEVALDEGKSEDDRLEALDNFEMLIENIDNANDIERLKMWPSLLSLLSSSSSSEIRTQILWIIGTSVQNNPSAQSAFLSHGSVANLLTFMRPETSKQSSERSKAAYALSGLLKHNAPAVLELGKPETQGWSILRDAFEDPDVTVRRKVVFLLNSLLIPSAPVGSSSTTTTNLHTPDNNPNSNATDPQSPSSDPVHANSHASMLRNPDSTNTSSPTFAAINDPDTGLLSTAVKAIAQPTPYGPNGDSEVDLDFEEKVIRLLYTFTASCQGQLSDEQKADLSSVFERYGNDKNLLERWGLEATELKELKKATE